MLVLVARRTIHAPDGSRPATAGVLVALVGLAGIAYLSVPDTEGLVLVGAALAAPTVAALAGWLVLRPGAALAVGGVGLGAIALVTWSGATAGWTPAGWWPAKVVLGALAVGGLAVAAVAARGLSPSAPARPRR